MGIFFDAAGLPYAIHIGRLVVTGHFGSAQSWFVAGELSY